jgi:hypothetical protein
MKTLAGKLRLLVSGAMDHQEGAPQGASYNRVTTNNTFSEGSKWPTYETPLDLREKILVEVSFKDREMEIDLAKGKSPASMPRLLGKCIPQAPQAPKYLISTPRIEEQKQYMRGYALVGKFLGLWPSERDLIKWIQHWWKSRGHYDLHLGSKGFFTIIFHNLEDQNRVFEGGPYFFNSAGLFLRFWTEKFSPEKEDFAHAPVWIILYSLPQEF